MSLYVDIEKKLGDFTLRAKFETESGVLGILGASGCGKSMTLKCIAGVEKPDRGIIRWDDIVFFDSERKINMKVQERRVGLLFQNYALFPNMTVLQNLRTALRARHLPAEEEKKEAGDMMRRFWLEGLEDLKPGQLSGGQQQRTALARILLSRPRILMLDEPFSALDEYLRWTLELELQELIRQFDGPVLFVSHSRDEVYRVCDRVCIMDHGKTQEPVPVKALFENPHTRAAALLSGCKNYSRCRKTGEHSLEAADWGVTLETAEAIPDNAAYAGIRSHFIRPVHIKDTGAAANLIRCRISRIIDDVFSTVILANAEPLCYNELSAHTGDPETDQFRRIRIEMTKEEWDRFAAEEQENDILYITIAPEDVMPLL